MQGLWCHTSISAKQDLALIEYRALIAETQRQIVEVLFIIYLKAEIVLQYYCGLFLLSGMRVFVHGGAATPLVLLEAVANHGKHAKLHDVEMIHIHTEGPGIYVQPEFEGGIEICKDFFKSIILSI